MAKSNPITISDDFIGYPLDSLCLPSKYKDDLESVLIPHGLINDRIERLADEISEEYTGESITFICVLKGGYRFFSSLVEKVQTIDRFQSSSQGSSKHPMIDVEFIRLKSYINDESSGNITVFEHPRLDSLAGQNVVIVEDIIDTGTTMRRLLELLSNIKIKSLKVSVLFYKRDTINQYQPDYIGFRIPNRFIVGCNLDFNEAFRDLNHVCVIKDSAKAKYASSKPQPM